MARSSHSKTQKKLNAIRREKFIMPKLKQQAWERYEKIKKTVLKTSGDSQMEFDFAVDRVGNSKKEVKVDGKNWKEFVERIVKK